MNKIEQKFWIEKEKEIQQSFISLRELNLEFYDKRRSYADSQYLVRKGVFTALKKSQKKLPKGYNLKIYDGWRPWILQQKCSKWFEKKIIKQNPDWTAKEIQKAVNIFAPKKRIVPFLASHRYGGAVDITLTDLEGKEYDLGCKIDSIKEPEKAKLLYYEFKDNISEKEIVIRNNRRILIKALSGAGFKPYLNEWWHWSFDSDC